MSPPYSGYTWHFTQHAVALNPKNLFALLSVAWQYRGKKPNSRAMSNNLVAQGILTSNVRKDSGVADAWRDYQQVLPELGLMVSTDVMALVSVTPVGMLLLDGSMGFSETLTNQALRYQYPNGFKWTISPEVREAIGQEADEFESLAHLQAAKGVLIKPAVLLLRTLLQLEEDGQEAALSQDECLAYIMPVFRHSDWQTAYMDLLMARVSGEELEPIGRKRNIQDWFRLLALTDLFSVQNGRLSLSETAKTKSVELEALCLLHEDPASFWIPTGQPDDRQKWFAHYGSYDLELQWVEPEPTAEYLKENYMGGVETEGIEVGAAAGMDINLADFDPEVVKERLKALGQFRPTPFNLQKAMALSERNSRLHEDIRIRLYERLKSRGYNVSMSVGGSDESIDLLSKKDDEEEVFEVKTVTRKNWRHRFRLGVGQLSEYRYRRQIQTGQRPSAILVFSARTEIPQRLTDFLVNDVKIGLMTFTDDRFEAKTNISSEGKIAD